jgi:hypothetical protein
MNERRRDSVSVKFAWAGLLVGALCLSPGAFAQGQSGAAAAGDAAGHSQNSPAAKAPANGSSSSSNANSGSSSGGSAAANSNAAAGSSNGSGASGQNAVGSSSEPEMVDQSAPAGDSLAEAARQARARKAKAGAAGANAPKVYTEDKLSQLSGHGVSVVGDGNAGGSGDSSSEESSYSGADSGASAAAGAGSNGEEYWRGKAKAIRDQMAQCDQEISKLQDEIAKYGAVSVDPQSGAMQSIIYVNDRNAKIKQIQDRKDSLQGQLDALEDEGRKAGADAGWFR